jgi:hypothetical protein
MRVFNPAPSFAVQGEVYLLVSAARRSGARIEVQVYLKRGTGALGVVLGSDTLNLATQAARELAAATLAKQAAVDPAVVEAVLIRVLEDADLRLRETEPVRPAPVSQAGSISSDEEREDARIRAREFLQHERPLELLAASLRRMGLGGSLVIPMMVFLAATTRLMSARRVQQCHLHVQGPTSSGKSHEVGAALEHLPEEAVLRFDGASPRALIYHSGDIRSRVLNYAEMDALPTGGGDDDASNTALTYLRTLASEGRARYSVVEKGEGGKYVTNHYEREGPAVLIVTGTRRLADEQLRSRMHEVEVEVTRERIHSVLRAQSNLLKGVLRGEPDPAVVAAQEYLQYLAPIDVQVPFAPVLAELFFNRVRTADPRLSRELSRVTGFTAAHALLRIEARGRTASGEVIAELEDYEAARAVVRELSTSREYPALAVKVWDAIAELYASTTRPVTVSDVKGHILRDHNVVRRAFNDLLDGGSLADRREKPGRTVPHLVTPVGERPGQVLLPSVEEILSYLPPKVGSKRGQVEVAQRDSLDVEAAGLDVEAIHLTGNELTPLRPTSGGCGEENKPEFEAQEPRGNGNGHDEDPTACPGCGKDNCIGDCGKAITADVAGRQGIPVALPGLGPAHTVVLSGDCSVCREPGVLLMYGARRICHRCAPKWTPASAGPTTVLEV